ncbi:MAG: hypothetical protein AB7S41_19930 [Parvibaculaceae bacterium]
MPRWIWDGRRGALVPAQVYEAAKAAERHGRAFGVMPDIAPFRSPIDGAEISSRSSLRAHERRHRVRQCGELKSVADFDNRKVKPFRSVTEGW